MNFRARSYKYSVQRCRSVATGQTARQIFTLNGSDDAESHKGVPLLALVDIAAHLRNQMAQNFNLGV